MNKYISAKPNILLTIMVFLVAFASGCCQEGVGTDKKLHFYMVIAPISDEAVKTSKIFFNNAKENVIDKTQIIFPSPNYTVAEICKGDEPQIPTSMTSFSDPNDIVSVTGGVERSLAEITKGDVKCTARAATLVNLSKNLNDAADKSDQNGELVVLIQIPWAKEEISDEVWNKLKENMRKLAETDKVKRIIIWGVDRDGADRLGQAFEAFNKSNSHKFDSLGQDGIIKELKVIRREILQVKQCKQ